MKTFVDISHLRILLFYLQIIQSGHNIYKIVGPLSSFINDLLTQLLVHNEESDQHVAGNKSGSPANIFVSFLEIGEVRKKKKIVESTQQLKIAQNRRLLHEAKRC